MTAFIEHLFGSVLLLVAATVGVVAVIHFIVQYAARGFLLRAELRKTARKVRALKSTSTVQIKHRLDEVFSKTRVSFAWSEFEETLHEQHDWKDGERSVVDIRATLPAEAFFNTETSVDPWLGSEYFKHLPGILTGLGIIGTFMGLIQGLVEFNPQATESEQLRQSLSGLFNEVRYAFTFSAVAITAAILITLFEKWLYSACAKWVGELAQSLDGLFRAGIGEEYLSSLVQASHESASQMRQLKESLVDDLKSLLTNLTERQIQATQQLSAEFSQQIERSLQAPLERIAETVRVASGQQHQAVGSVLENLMTAFMAQMRETMGGQLGDLGSLLRQSTQSMTQVELAMRTLVTDMQKVSQDSSTAVHASMRELMDKLADHQKAQSNAVSASTQVVMERLQQAIARMAEAHEKANSRTSESVDAVAAAMQDRISGLAAANAQNLEATHNAVEQIGAVSRDVFDKLASGASAVSASVSGLNEAMEKMGRVAERLATLENNAIQSAHAVTQATNQLGTASQSLSTAMGQLAGTSSRLENVAQSATTEAAARGQLLRDLKEVMTRSEQASAEFAKLAEQVRSTLVEAVDQFGGNVSNVLSQHLTDYQKQLGDAVSMLSGALEELSEFASDARD